MHVIAAKAVAFREAQGDGFRAYQRQLVANASRLAERLAAAGFRIVSGGTDNHVFLLDVHAVGLTGKVGERALEQAAITVNKNTIPYDPNPPMVASGIRLGTPAVTSRGLGLAEMDAVGDLIARALRGADDPAILAAVRADVAALAARFPLYAELA